MGLTIIKMVVALALVLKAAGAPAVAVCMNSGSKEEVAEGGSSFQRVNDAPGRSGGYTSLHCHCRHALGSTELNDRVKSPRTLHIFASNAATIAVFVSLSVKTWRIRGRAGVS